MSDRVNSRAAIRRYVAELEARDPESERSVRYWQAAGRLTLLLLFAYSALQYYFFDVYLTIMALPQATLIAALP